jgi:hypothetical protein
MAEEKMLAPRTTIWFVPGASIANRSVGPTLTEINTSGVNISCAILTGYTLNATDSDTDDTRSICDEGNVDTYTDGNYEGDLTFFREGDTAATTGVFYQAFNLFKQPAQGAFVKRIGKLSTDALVSGDDISWFDGETDYTVNNDEGTNPKTFQVKLIPSGYFGINVDAT